MISNHEIEHHKNLYYVVYSKIWQREEIVGPRFHRDLTVMAAEKEWLRSGFPFYNQAAIASQLWIACEDTAFIMKKVYDQNYKKYSPRIILTSKMMKYVIDVDKVRIVDYFPGDESYKEVWAPETGKENILFIP